MCIDVQLLVLLHTVHVGTHPYWINLHTVVNNDWLEVTL